MLQLNQLSKGYVVDTENGTKRRGRPSGIPREGRYGTGIKTKVVRVPKTVADNIQDILQSFEAIKLMVDSWDEKVEGAIANSSRKNEIPPRYDQAVKLLGELRNYLGE